MSTTCVYSDIVLPTATWYEKNDLNTSDMHPFIHPLTGGGGSGLGIAQRLGDLQGHRQAFSEVAPEVWASRRTWC
jgi:nitrate reductase alpha subunit